MKHIKVLLIIDLQRVFKPPVSLVHNIQAMARQYDFVVATQFVDGNHLYKTIFKFSPLTKSELALVSLPKGTKVFKKTGYGLPQRLFKFLKKLKVQKVDVCGVETDACVLAAMFDLWDAGIQPNLLKKLTNSRNKKAHRAALLISKRNFRV